MSEHTTNGIRNATMMPATSWVKPSGNEVRTVLSLAGLSAAAAAEYLGLGRGGDRTVRRWLEAGEGDSSCAYPIWALLCYRAQLGIAWVLNADHHSRQEKSL